MKYAVIISGMYREFDHCVSTWTFLKHLGDDIDYYFSTWDKSEETNENLGIDISEPVTIERIEQHVKPISYCIEPLENGDGQPGIKNMLARWAQGIDLVIGSKINYDKVIIIRPDVFIDGQDWEFARTLMYMSPNTFFTPGGLTRHRNGATGQVVDGINDFIIAGDLEVMKSISRIDADSQAHGRIVDIHEWICAWMLKHGAIDDLRGLERYCLFRSISRNRITRDWDTINTDAGLWWENKHGVKY